MAGTQSKPTTAKSGGTSMNVTGTNPENKTNIGSDVNVDVERQTDVNVDDVNVSSEDETQRDVRTRVESISGIRIPGATFHADKEPDDQSVEDFEKAYAKANPDAAPGMGRQYANTARAMGYSVKIK